MNEDMEIFNKEDIYDNEISPLIRQLIDLCKKHGMPMLASIAYENCPDKGLGLCITLVNNIPDRPCDTLQKAARVLRESNDIACAITVTKSSPQI